MNLADFPVELETFELPEPNGPFTLTVFMPTGQIMRRIEDREQLLIWLRLFAQEKSDIKDNIGILCAALKAGIGEKLGGKVQLLPEVPPDGTNWLELELGEYVGGEPAPFFTAKAPPNEGAPAITYNVFADFHRNKD